jgi:cellulose synthase operon protein C
MKTFFLSAATALTLCACSVQSGGATLSAAQALYDRGDFVAANVALMNAVAARPSDPAIQLLRARVFLQIGNGVAAEGAAAQARALGAQAPVLATLAAEAALLQNDTAKAARLIAAADGVFEHPWDQERLNAQRMLLDREYHGALEQFAVAAVTGPNDPRNHIGLGNAQMLTGDYTGALRSAETAIALKPALVAPYMLAGRTALFQQHFAAALGYFDTALKREPKNAAAMFGKASVFGDTGQHVEMQKWVRRGRKIAPGDPFGLFLAARLAANSGDFERAHVLMEQAGDGLAGDAIAATFAGEMAIRMGYTATAIGHFERAIAAAPQITHIYILLAGAQAANNEPAAALATLRRFDSFDPLPAEVAELRARITRG